MKLSNSPEDVAIALQGEALLRSSSVSSASRPSTPSSSPNLTRVNTLETTHTSPPPTPQHITTSAQVPLKKSQIPELAHPVKQHQSVNSTFFDTRLYDTRSTAELDCDRNTFKETIWEHLYADKEERKTQSTPNTPRRSMSIEAESDAKYPWPPKMVGGSGRYRHAEEATAPWIEENAISQMENNGIAEVVGNFAMKRNLSIPDGTSIANIAAIRLHRAYHSPPKEVSHEIDEDGVHIFKGFNASGKALKPILRTKSEPSVQINEAAQHSIITRNKASFNHSGKLVDPFGGPSQASYKTPSLSDEAHPLSQSYRATANMKRVLALHQQVPINYPNDESAIESDSEDEWLGGMDGNGNEPTKVKPAEATSKAIAGPSENRRTDIQPTFTANKKLVPRPAFVRTVSLLHEQLQMRYSSDETAIESYTEDEVLEKAVEGAGKTVEELAQIQKETAQTMLVRSKGTAKIQPKTATGSKVVPKVKVARKTSAKKAVRFSKQLVTKVNNEVSAVIAEDPDDHADSANTTDSSDCSGSSVEVQLKAQQMKGGRQPRKDSTDPSSVSSGEDLSQQKKLSSKAKGKQRAVETDGNNSDSSTATVVYKPAKVGRKRAVTAIRIPKVEVAVEGAGAHS